MSDYSKCKNGHYFPKNLKTCPYCPSQNQEKSPLEKTKVQTELSDEITKTKVLNTENQSNNLAKTIIETPISETPKVEKTKEIRKLVGWLVSFTIDANGKDFKLFEGRNSIGSSETCDVVISGDNKTSAHHLTILHRRGEVKFRDELSTNCTFLNSQFSEEGVLKDNDELKIGDNTFIVKLI